MRAALGHASRFAMPADLLVAYDFPPFAFLLFMSFSPRPVEMTKPCKPLGEQRIFSSAKRNASTSLGTLAVVVLVAGASLFGGYRWWVNRPQGEQSPTEILHTVARGDFVHQVTERGEILSSGVTEIRSEVKSNNTPGVAILRVIPEGSHVKKGDFLVELDSSALESERTSQKIMVNTSEAIVIEARNVYETALIAQREYVEGTFVESKQTIESEIFVAEENLNRAKEYFEYSNKLASKGYVNELQLQADKFAVEKTAKELEAAKTKLMVLENFTRAKTVKQLDSDVLIAKAKWEAEKNSLELEIQKLRDIELQIASCTIVAPQDGIVKYAHENDRRGEDNFIVEEGAMIRERQVILSLPDSSAMQVEININESLVQYVQPGMPATIVPVGLDGLELKGSVDSVNQYAEPSGWRKANVKEYKAFVNLDQSSPSVRAGMTASVTIKCSQVPSAMQVPVQSVYAHGENYYCFVYRNNQWDAQVVECGPTNDKFFVVESGLQESDRVSMNPRSLLDRVSLPELPPEQRQQAVPQRPPSSQEVAAENKNLKVATQAKTGESKSGG